MHLISCEVGSMSDSSADSLADWTLVDHEESTEDNDNREDNDEGENVPPDEEEENERESEEDEDVVALGQKVEEVKDADTESLSSETAATESKLRKRRSRKPEAMQDEETDLSLASSPSLPDDLPAIKPDSQYVHHPDKRLNTRLNLIVALTIACVLGLGLGHFLGIVDFMEDEDAGWSSRSLWEENLNAAQVLESLSSENGLLEQKISKLQTENLEPIKIKGKDGKEARVLREQINRLISENEDMRIALGRHHFSTLPGGDKTEYNKLAQENHHLRTSVAQLKHLVPDLSSLQNSLKNLKKEHQDLLIEVGKVRYQEPVPKELTPLVKQLEEMKLVVAQEAKKKKPPNSIHNAKSYITFMSQVLSAFSYIHDLDGKSTAEKIELTKDAFIHLIPKGYKISTKFQEDILKSRKQFHNLKSSLQKKWKQLKELTKPESIVTVGKSTVSKMNRVIVNVVNKIKDIAQSTIMNSSKQIETSVVSLYDNLGKLNRQFDEAWKSLEIRTKHDDIYEGDDTDDDDDDDDEDDEDDDDNDGDDADNDLDDEVDDVSSKKDDEKKDRKVEKPSKVDVPTPKAASPRPPPPSKPAASPAKKATPKAQMETPKIREEIQKQMKGKDDGKKPPPAPQKKEAPARAAKPQEKQQQKDKGEKAPPTPKEETRDSKVKKQKKSQEEEEKKDEKKTLREKMEARKEAKQALTDDSRYFKGQYNKFDRAKIDPKDLRDKKHQKDDDDDDDDNDDDDDDNDDDDDDEEEEDKKGKRSGLRRHWDKPESKKSLFRGQSAGPKKQFISRRG